MRVVFLDGDIEFFPAVYRYAVFDLLHVLAVAARTIADRNEFTVALGVHGFAVIVSEFGYGTRFFLVANAALTRFHAVLGAGRGNGYLPFAETVSVRALISACRKQKHCRYRR